MDEPSIKNEPCGHVPARPDVDLTYCWKCGELVLADPDTHLWRLLSDTERLVRRETLRELRNYSTRTSSIRITEGSLGRWVIVNGEREDLAWSGSRWVPHREGLPTGEAQVSNFATREEAVQCAREQFPDAVRI